ncbi:hypothetical protein D3C87_1610770 [compost metagenome]
MRAGNRSADARVGQQLPQYPAAFRLTQRQMMHYRQKVMNAFTPGRVLARGISESGHGHRLVQDDPVPYPVAKCICANCRIFGKPFDNAPVLPAAGFFQYLGQVPVIQRNPRFYPQGNTLIYQPVIEIQTSLVDAPVAIGQDP